MYKNDYQGLLKSWCDAMLELQVTEIKKEGIYGGIMCPSCSRIHGRSLDALYSLMHMAHSTNDRKYLDAAKLLFDWSSHVSRPDGSFINDTSAIWKGITVFSVIQLGEAILNHGSILETDVLTKWKERLRSAAEFLYSFINMTVSNINYPITCSAALAVAGTVFEEPRYFEKARELAHMSLEYFTPNNLLYGEGKPHTAITPKGGRPVDLGYNVEESLGGLTMYGLLTNDTVVLDKVTEALEAHLEFMLPDGAWDNSWGTRSSKWTYWGSRTSDGCQIAYGLLGDHNPVFAEAAHRNLMLYKECTHDGLLHGGPHYNNIGELPCVHHTFTHAKALATILDHDACGTGKLQSIKIPREIASGVREYPEINTYLIAIGQWRATVTDSDWEYVNNGNASGGAITMLWNQKVGPLLTGTMTEYQTIEPNNMQIPIGLNHECLTPRLQYQENGILYKSINNFTAKMTNTSNKDEITVDVKGRLTDNKRNDPQSGEISYDMTYIFRPDTVEIQIDVKSDLGVVYHLPVISKHQEVITILGENSFAISKADAKVIISANTQLEIQDNYKSKRIYNLAPGFEAIPMVVNIIPGKITAITIKV